MKLSTCAPSTVLTRSLLKKDVMQLCTRRLDFKKSVGLGYRPHVLQRLGPRRKPPSGCRWNAAVILSFKLLEVGH